jgi:hypothetical protein
VHILRMLISSADVLHAWTVPSLGVKADAVPGRKTLEKWLNFIIIFEVTFSRQWKYLVFYTPQKLTLKSEL